MLTDEVVKKGVSEALNRYNTYEVMRGSPGSAVSWTAIDNLADAVRDLAEATVQLMNDREELAEILHRREMHPHYEYTTTTGPRKAFYDVEPEGDGWEPNIARGGGDAWERFDYHEEAYWRRLKGADQETA